MFLSKTEGSSLSLSLSLQSRERERERVDGLADNIVSAHQKYPTIISEAMSTYKLPNPLSLPCPLCLSSSNYSNYPLDPVKPVYSYIIIIHLIFPSSWTNSRTSLKASPISQATQATLPMLPLKIHLIRVSSIPLGENPSSVADFAIIGLDSVESKFGGGKIDPQKYRSTNEKVTDGIRNEFEKETGYAVTVGSLRVSSC